MSAGIIDRGRGPEIAGTRVTVYRVLDYIHEGSSPRRMAAELDLTDEQVQAALDYIQHHRNQVEAEYAAIRQRGRSSAPEQTEAELARLTHELKSRIAAR